MSNFTKETNEKFVLTLDGSEEFVYRKFLEIICDFLTLTEVSIKSTCSIFDTYGNEDFNRINKDCLLKHKIISKILEKSNITYDKIENKFFKEFSTTLEYKYYTFINFKFIIDNNKLIIDTIAGPDALNNKIAEVVYKKLFNIITQKDLLR